MSASCAITSKRKDEAYQKETETDNNKQECLDALLGIQEDLFNLSPIKDGAEATISYLESLPNYIRNKEYDLGNGSVRFNAKGASVYGYELQDEKSLFLINYHIAGGHKDKIFLFQAIYYFQSEEDKKAMLKQIKYSLEGKLQLEKEIKYDAARSPYDRYYLPCGSGINLKYSKSDDERNIIDILWIDEGLLN